MTARRRCGIDSASVSSSPVSMLWCQIEMIFAFSSVTEVNCWVHTFFLSKYHRFSMGFRSGDWGGQSRVFQPWDRMKFMTDLDLWQGAPSSCKQKSWPWNREFTDHFTCWLKTFKYHAVLHVSPFSKNRTRPTPDAANEPHSMRDWVLDSWSDYSESFPSLPPDTQFRRVIADCNACFIGEQHPTPELRPLLCILACKLQTQTSMSLSEKRFSWCKTRNQAHFLQISPHGACTNYNTSSTHLLAEFSTWLCWRSANCNLDATKLSRCHLQMTSALLPRRWCWASQLIFLTKLNKKYLLQITIWHVPYL